jgi:hypothetical protein
VKPLAGPALALLLVAGAAQATDPGRPAPMPDPAQRAALITELENLHAMRRELLRRFTRRYPDVRFLEAEIRRLQARLAPAPPSRP